jgi:hypothetical protein
MAEEEAALAGAARPAADLPGPMGAFAAELDDQRTPRRRHVERMESVHQHNDGPLEQMYVGLEEGRWDPLVQRAHHRSGRSPHAATLLTRTKHLFG